MKNHGDYFLFSTAIKITDPGGAETAMPPFIAAPLAFISSHRYF
jgi:hypothetical protein